jgi:hypothetical protein
MPSLSCSRCGVAATGKFCSSCGASLAARSCPSCGHVPGPGARFCTRCGACLAGEGGAAAMRAPDGSGSQGEVEPGVGSSVAWWIAGGAMVALILSVAWPVIRPGTPDLGLSMGGRSGGQGAAVGPAVGGGAPPDLSSMTPREAADRLYDRVMNAVSQSDEATVQNFLPMAVAAYDLARPLDADGLYHLSALQRAGADFAGSLVTAAGGLETNRDHLLLLATSGEAAEALEQGEAAREYWQRFLDVYDRQRSMGLEEYGAHEGVLETSRNHARQVVGN